MPSSGCESWTAPTSIVSEDRVSSIKPPGALPLPSAPADPALGGTGAIGQAAPGIETPAAQRATAPMALRETLPSDAIGQLAHSVRAGNLSVEQAMERLLEHAVSGVQVRLSETERAELVALLRSALAQDPALISALQESLR